MILTILIFIIILGLLVFVHEFGHFVVAKKSGMKVLEFGFGFPPRIFGIQVLKENKIISSSRTETVTALETDIRTTEGEVVVEKITDTVKETQEAEPRKKWHLVWGHKPPIDPEQTVYSVNWIPLGGFVKIYGENNEHENDPDSFINKPFWARFTTLVAGVLMNVILAWVLISIGFTIGMPTALDNQAGLPASARFTDAHTAIIEVSKDSPAAKAGLLPGDKILRIDGRDYGGIEDIREYILANAGKIFNFSVGRAGQEINIAVSSLKSPAEGQGPTGIVLAQVGTLSFPWYRSVWEGGKVTALQLEGIVSGLYRLFTTRLGFEALGGPVKIAQITGQVADMGFIYLLQFTSFLSLNLAILNILPFPALDGGRVIFLTIEKLRKKRNNPKIEQAVNAAGFAFLILLMILVTIKDVRGFGN